MLKVWEEGVIACDIAYIVEMQYVFTSAKVLQTGSCLIECKSPLTSRVFPWEFMWNVLLPFQDWGLFAPQYLRGLEATVLCLRAVADVASILAVEHEGSNKSSDVQALPRKAAVIIGVRRLRCVGFSPCSLPHCLDS